MDRRTLLKKMAAELALEQTERRAAVIGCGVAGLTTTRQLQRRGFDVTIYAMSVPANTTSNMSLASWTPGRWSRMKTQGDASWRRTSGCSRVCAGRGA